MGVPPLPSNQVINEARLYREAALLLEQNARQGNVDMYWPAAMNAALAVELYLKSFLVESEVPAVALTKEGKKASHNLIELYEAITLDYQKRIEAVNQTLSPTLDLVRMFETFALHFPTVRYSYEAKSVGVIRVQLFGLMDRMEEICSTLLPQVTRAEV